MCRNGACASIAPIAAIRSPSNGVAKPCKSMAPSAILCCTGPACAAVSNRSPVKGARSFGIMKDHAERMAVPGTDPAYAVAEIDPISSTRPLNRSHMHREGHRIALSERLHLGPGLHARALLRQYKLAAAEIAARFGQETRNL